MYSILIVSRFVIAVLFDDFIFDCEVLLDHRRATTARLFVTSSQGCEHEANQTRLRADHTLLFWNEDGGVVEKQNLRTRHIYSNVPLGEFSRRFLSLKSLAV